MFVRLLAAALDDPLGAPGVVSISDTASNGVRGNICGIGFSSLGNFYKYLGGYPEDISAWLTPQANMGDYEIRATLSSGDTPAGTFGSWTSLATSQEWTLQNGTPATTLTCQVLIEIRWTGDNVVQDSATYTLTAQGPTS